MRGMKTIVVITIVILVLGAIITFPYMNFRLIRASGGGGELLWENNEAYLFLYDAPDGYRLTGASLLVEPIREYFHAPAFPDNRKIALTILHITASGVERYEQSSEVAIESFTPIADAIYADCPGGICKWTGSNFKLIKADAEHQAVEGVHLAAIGMNSPMRKVGPNAKSDRRDQWKPLFMVNFRSRLISSSLLS